MEHEIKTTERGWAGHFCAADDCKFRRNTLVEYGDVKIVVSTIGVWFLMGKIEKVGCNRYYETMAFHSCEKDTKYNDIDVEREVILDCKTQIDRFDEDTDNEANEMHDNAVKWVCEQLKKGVEL